MLESLEPRLLLAQVVGAWEFENSFANSAGSGIYDFSPVGSVAFVPGFNGGFAAEFDGGTTTYPNNGSVDSLHTTGPDIRSFNGVGMSIIAVVNPDVNGGTILGQDRSVPNARAYGYQIFFYPNGQIGLNMRDSSDRRLNMTSGVGIPAGDWTHVAVTWNGSSSSGASMYINGNMVSSSFTNSGFSGLSLSSAPLVVGAAQGDANSNITGFSGVIDHLSLWQGELTAAEVLDDFNSLTSVDLIAQSLTIDQGIVNFSYEIAGAPLPNDTTVNLYWSDDAVFDSTDVAALAQPITIASGTAPDTYQGSRTLAQLTTQLPTATHLLFVIDPDNVIKESDEPNPGDFGQNNTKPLALVDVIKVASFSWDAIQGGANATIEALFSQTSVNADVAFYWANGTSLSDRVGGPIHQENVFIPVGIPIVVNVDAGQLATPPITLAPPSIGATHLLVVANQSVVVPENLANNSASLQLKRVTLGTDFNLVLGNESLNSELLTRFMNLSGFLIGNNFINANITLDEGVRAPETAHRWSTAWAIMTRRNEQLLLTNLRDLPDGQDLDGNTWYDAQWEVGLPQLPNGRLTRAGLELLWGRIQKNVRDRDYLVDPNNPQVIAAEGYRSSDPRRLPNVRNVNVSNHIVGLALDANIPWRAGVTVNNLTILTGDRDDPAANRIIQEYRLRRPVIDEPWHFQMTQPPVGPGAKTHSLFSTTNHEERVVWNVQTTTEADRFATISIGLAKVPRQLSESKLSPVVGPLTDSCKNPEFATGEYDSFFTVLAIEKLVWNPGLWLDQI